MLGTVYTVFVSPSQKEHSRTRKGEKGAIKMIKGLEHLPLLKLLRLFNLEKKDI